MTIKEALNSIDEINLKEKITNVNLFEAKGKILANDFFAKKNSPVYTNSAMDGFALKNNEFKKGLKIIKTIFAGDLQECEIKSGECVKIMTGAKIPKGANSVLMVEKSEIKDDKMYATCENLMENESIRMQGEEYFIGDLLLKKGVINDEMIMILASNGVFSIDVAQDIKVGIFASGKELIEPFSSAYGVYNSNAYGIYSMLKDISKVNYLGILQDEYDMVKNSLQGAFLNYDLIVSIGAASVGEADFIKKALDELKFKPVFTKVKMKPAGPVSLFYKDDKFILVLPGNPMSAYVGALIYAKKIIYKMQGVKYLKQSYKCEIASDLKVKNGKETIIMGNLLDNKFVPYNNGKINSAQISPIYKCSHYIICPIDCELKAGDIVEIYEKNI